MDCIGWDVTSLCSNGNMGDFKTLDRTATSQHGVLTSKQLQAAGYSLDQIKYRTRTGHLRRIQTGVYGLAGTPPTWEHRASAAALATEPFGALSHRSAARQWQFRTVDDDIDVVVRYPRRLALPGATVHRSRDLAVDDITWVNGISTTTPERTICDLGLIFPDHEVQRILDHAVATNTVTPYDIERLRRRISERGRDGAGTIRRCLDRLPAQAAMTESGPEVLFLRLCEEQDLPAPTLQLPVVVQHRLFRVDFAYPTEKVFIEIDGRATHGEYQQIANDGGRQNLLVANGWHPLRFMAKDLKQHPARCAASVRSLLQSVNRNG